MKQRDIGAKIGGGPDGTTDQKPGYFSDAG
jgi:hypothetical protein